MLNDIPQVVTRQATVRREGNEVSSETMTSSIGYFRSQRAMEHTDSMSNPHDDDETNEMSNDFISYNDKEDSFGNCMDKEDILINQDDEGHLVDNIHEEEDSKPKSGKQFRTMVNRLAPTPGFVDKNSLPSDLMTRSRVKRVASLNAAAKVNAFFEPSSPLAGRSITDIMQHSKKLQGGEGSEDEFPDDSYVVKPRGRPRLASISMNDPNFLQSPELLSEAAHAFLGNTQYDSENSASLKRLQEGDGNPYEAKRVKVDINGGYMRQRVEQNGDHSTIISDRRIFKGKEVVDVGLQVKIPKVKSGKNQIPNVSSVQCTCRSSTLIDIPVKSYVSTYANGTLVSIPITKTHRLNPHVPEKPLPELAQGDLANQSKLVAGLNSRAMLNAILCQERQLPDAQKTVAKPARKMQEKRYYQHGLNNTVPSKLKIPKINFAATSTSNFGGRKMLGNQKTPSTLWSKSGIASHDGPKVILLSFIRITTDAFQM